MKRASAFDEESFERKQKTKRAKAAAGTASGKCACGAVEIEIGTPARWAWHDHSKASQLAQGCQHATYVGSYKSRFRIVTGEQHVKSFVEPKTKNTRNFCSLCGTPLFYERARARDMVNIPRALLEGRTGREPRYHLSLDDAPEWAYRGEKLAPLKGFPGVLWERPKRKKPKLFDTPF
ncbi:MAG TPA: GFA family protein [Rhizomicrobium sp.]|nr:GFA family protein [Rhizomicrobium sp.]